ncbi:MAG TPA: ATP-binding protein [Actinomycetes bacterium]|jgi:signal transduction histidine kinase|nr:ATP-binding protein [Actinomycetes bacterium]
MWRLGLVLLAGGVLGLTAERVGFGWGDPRHWIPDLAVGWSFIGCGLVASRRRPESRTGPLMAATGFTWFLGNFANVGVPAVAWGAAHLVYLHRGPLVQLVLTYPSGRPGSRPVRGAVAVGYAVAVITPIWRSAGVTILLAGLLVAVCARDHVRSVGQPRRARLIGLQAAAGLSLVLAGTAAARLLLPPEEVSGPSLLVYELALCVLAGGLLAGLLVAPWQRAAVTDLVVELGEARSGTLRGELSRALGDPSLAIGYWLPDRGVFVDAEGRVLSLPGPGSGRSVTVVEREGRPVAVLVHDPAVLEDLGLLEAVTSAAQLAASNARLQAEVQARVVELAASRRRILAARDEERRRLERRLHDGAEARLGKLAATLRRSQGSASGEQTRDQIAHAQDQLVRTLEELRRLAHGLHPRVLSEHGLADALAALAKDLPLPVDINVASSQLPQRVAVAAYFVCAEALANVAKHAAAAHVAVAVTASEDRLRVEIADDGVGGADPGRGSGLRGLADRVETFGGTLRVESVPGHGTRLAAEIPLGGEAR